MVNKALIDINKLTPYAVGFDRIFQDMHRYMEHTSQSTGYPPYNILRKDNEFRIELALAGVSKKDLDIEVAEGLLTITHDPLEVEQKDTVFSLANDVVVRSAEMINGMLHIYLERIIPDEKKPRTISIS
jgi:molecular chaperone IbpA